jgi:hypothetical protein
MIPGFLVLFLRSREKTFGQRGVFLQPPYLYAPVILTPDRYKFDARN